MAQMRLRALAALAIHFCADYFALDNKYRRFGRWGTIRVMDGKGG
jgi:hypothetical protein